MFDLRKQQSHFLNYLLGDESTEIVKDIESTTILSAKDRLNIYAYAYRSRLKEALLTDYNILASYLGDEQFDQLMNTYIDRYPSHTTSLRYFSSNIPELLQKESPFSNFQELYELAIIERAFADSFDAKDQQIVSIEGLAELAPEAWGDLQFIFQKSVQLLYLQTNSFSIWKALSEQSTPEKIISTVSTPWLLWRQSDLITHYRALSEAEETAFNLAISGESFAVICESLLQFYDEEETPLKAIIFLKSWIQEEMISQLCI